MTGLSKYEELRAKTNEQLIKLIAKELDLGFDHIAGGRPEQGETSCISASQLMQLAYDISGEKRHVLEFRLNELQKALTAAALSVCVYC